MVSYLNIIFDSLGPLKVARHVHRLLIRVLAINLSDKTYDSMNPIIKKKLFFPLILKCFIFPRRSLVYLANEHLSFLREVCVINDSITHHPMRSHSTQTHTLILALFREPPTLQETEKRICRTGWNRQHLSVTSDDSSKVILQRHLVELSPGFFSPQASEATMTNDVSVPLICHRTIGTPVQSNDI